MRTKVQRLALLGMLMGALLGTGLMAPAGAAGMTQIDGDATIDTAGPCGTPQPGFPDYAGLQLTGDLQGCWYTAVESVQNTPSGGYHERGRELFIGSMNGGTPRGRSRRPTSSRASTRRTASPRSTDAATTRSPRGRGPAGSRVRPGGSTSRTSSVTRWSTNTEDTSHSADAVAPAPSPRRNGASRHLTTSTASPTHSPAADSALMPMRPRHFDRMSRWRQCA